MAISERGESYFDVGSGGGIFSHEDAAFATSAIAIIAARYFFMVDVSPISFVTGSVLLLAGWGLRLVRMLNPGGSSGGPYI